MTADEIAKLHALRDQLRSWYNGTDAVGGALSAAPYSSPRNKFIAGFNSVADGMVAGKAQFIAAIAEIDALIAPPKILSPPEINGTPTVGTPILYTPGTYE